MKLSMIVLLGSFLAAGCVKRTPEVQAPKAESHTQQSKEQGKTKSCAAIREACKKAGYVAGGWKDKNGIESNCVKPLVNGEKVPRLSQSFESVALDACKMEVAALDKARVGSQDSQGTKK